MEYVITFFPVKNVPSQLSKAFFSDHGLIKNLNLITTRIQAFKITMRYLYINIYIKVMPLLII